MPALPSDRETALLTLHDRLTRSGIPYQLGGSAMMVLRGIDVGVHDLDLVFPASARDHVARSLGEWWEGFETMDHPEFASEWIARITVDDIPVDLVGGFAIAGETPLPFEEAGRAPVGEAEIPLAPVDQWIRIYERYDPGKARLLAQL